jgi:hypothetical protein
LHHRIITEINQNERLLQTMTEEKDKVKKPKSQKKKKKDGEKKSKKKKSKKDDVTKDHHHHVEEAENVIENNNGIVATNGNGQVHGAASPPTVDTNEVSSLNRYYGNRKGAIATLSMILNAGLMVYAHVGISAVVLSSQPPVSGDDNNEASQPPLSGVCDQDDLQIWQTGGQENRAIHSNFCSREYQGTGCLLDAACIGECFAGEFGYSQNCSTCFGAVPQCGFDQGCALICASDSFSVECQECNEPCTRQLDKCLGFPVGNETMVPTANRKLQEGVCTELDLESLDWFVVYELTFINSIEKAWNGARFLAIIIVVFSGIWPYAKNIVLVWAWYWPLSVKNRTTVLTWLLRLSKYTLVDVFAVISVLVGVLLQLNVGGTQVATRAEPRPAILAFFLATLWEFCHIEWVVHCHDHHVHYHDDDNNENEASKVSAENMEQGDGPEENPAGSSSKDQHLLDAMKFRTKLSSNDDTLSVKNTTAIRAWVAFLLVSTLTMYLAGATTELVQFTSFGAGDDVGCKRSYNLVTLGNAMVSELALTSNNSKASTWTLYIAYVILVLFLPIVVHVLQIVSLSLATFGNHKDKNRKVCRVTSSLWGFSSVEVLLIGIYSVESKFYKFVTAFAGNESAQFFTISSSLGPAFSILLVYGILSGVLQYFIYCATAEYYKIDPYHKVHVMWTKLFGCWLKQK